MKCECGKEVPLSLASNRTYFKDYIEDPVAFEKFYLEEYDKEEFDDFLIEWNFSKDNLDDVNFWFYEIEIPLDYTCDCGKEMDVYYNKQKNEMCIREEDYYDFL